MLCRHSTLAPPSSRAWQSHPACTCTGMTAHLHPSFSPALETCTPEHNLHISATTCDLHIISTVQTKPCIGMTAKLSYSHLCSLWFAHQHIQVSNCRFRISTASCNLYIISSFQDHPYTSTGMTACRNGTPSYMHPSLKFALQHHNLWFAHYHRLRCSSLQMQSSYVE